MAFIVPSVFMLALVLLIVFSVRKRRSLTIPISMATDKTLARTTLQQTKQAAKTVNTTVDPETFFKRLHFMIDGLMYLQNCVGFIHFKEMSPTRNLSEVLKNLETTVNEFINRSYQNEVAKIIVLKTPEAREKRRLKYAEHMIDAFEKSNTYWSGSYFGGVALPHYSERLYSDNNMAYLKKILYVNSPESEVLSEAKPRPVTIKALSSASRQPVSAGARKSKIVNFQTQKWFEAARSGFTIVDIETTGLSRDTDHIIELAAIRYRNGVEVSEYSRLVKPPIKVPKESTAIHGITDSMLKNASAIRNVIPEFLAFVGDDLLAGHNVNFDLSFIENAARKYGHDPEWNYIDTISVAKKAIPGLDNYKQQTVIKALGYKQPRAHRAEDDCRGCAQILLYAINQRNSESNGQSGVVAPLR